MGGDKRGSHNNQGWHLACCGRNQQGEPLFVGFSEKISRPFTHKEHRGILLEEYPLTEQASSQIGGVRSLRALNEQALSAALLATRQPAQAQQIGFIGQENKTNLLSTFKATTATSKAMLQGARDFVQAVESNPNKSAVLLIEGVPGIGKTHLAVGILRELEEEGRTACFITPTAISDTYNLVGPEKFWRQMGNILNARVIVIDDVNSAYGVGRQIQELALAQASREPKTIIITSNPPPGPNDPCAQVHRVLPSRWVNESPGTRISKVLDGLVGESQRRFDPYTGLHDAATKPYRGTLVAQLNPATREALAKRGNAVRFMNWDEVNRPYFIDGELAADTFVIEVPPERYGAQLDRLAVLLERFHNLGGKKIIIATGDTSPEAFGEEFKERMKYSSHLSRENTTRFTDRWRALFGS